MSNRRATPLELVGLLVMGLGLCGAIYLAWRGGSYAGVAALAALDLLVWWSLAEALRQGTRRPTRFQRFESLLLLRALAVFVGGGAALALLRPSLSPALLLLLAVWLALSALATRRLRGRHETSGAYKARVGYEE